MIRGFIAKGYDVDLIVSKVHSDLLAKGDIKPFEVPDKTNIIVLKDRKASKNIREIRQYLKTTDSAAIIAMSSNYNQALALASIGLRKKPKLAYVEHSSMPGLDKLQRPKVFSQHYLMTLLFNKVYDVIMGVSEGTSRAVEFILRRKKDSVIPVYNPVIDDTYLKKLQDKPKHPWLADKVMPTFIAAGAHCGFKNHKLLFESFMRVNQVTPARLILFGKGELTDEYEQWIKENGMEEVICLAGHTDNLPAELKEADAFLISSNIESFSVVLVEALVAGVPVISTNCPYGPPELLQGGKYGTLVPVNDAKAMADAILAQISNPKPAAPKQAWQPYTLENVVAAYEKALGLN